MDKQEQYRQAMEKYENHAVYRNIGSVVALIIVSLQLASIASVQWEEASYSWIVLLAMAYIVADFVNGIVHMVMDNHDDYTSIIGPLVAAFHRHHHQPIYRQRHFFLAFLTENGMKNWLAIYMIAIVSLNGVVSAPAFFGLAAFSIWSSVAELSHYLCHNSSHRFVRLLQSLRIILHPEYHRVHHESDNTHYGFLNGMTDPVINWTAKRLYPKGYIATTDAHARDYYS